MKPRCLSYCSNLWSRSWFFRTAVPGTVILAASILLNGCGGGGGGSSSGSGNGGTPSPSPSPVAGSAIKIRDVEINSLPNNASQISFSIESVELDSSAGIMCRWQSNINDTISANIDFDCHVGSENQLEFANPTQGDITGRLSADAPGVSLQALDVEYIVEANSSTGQLIDVSAQFDTSLANQFYLLSESGFPQRLLYLPKRMELRSSPGIASVSSGNNINAVLEIFLRNSTTDWISQEQLTFNTRYSLGTDTQALAAAAQNQNFTELRELRVQPPIIHLSRRYVTDISANQLQVNCDNLSQIINNKTVTLLDCTIMDTATPNEKQTINYIGNVLYEDADFDPGQISSHENIRGLLNVEYTLPGTLEINDLFSAQAADLSTTFQLSFEWPTIFDNVTHFSVSFDWSLIVDTLITEINAGMTQWTQTTLNTLAQNLIADGYIVVQDNPSEGSLNNAIVEELKEELFVEIISANNMEQTLFWVPRIRFENLSSQIPEVIEIQHYQRSEDLISHLRLDCLGAPDTSNHIFRVPNC